MFNCIQKYDRILKLNNKLNRKEGENDFKKEKETQIKLTIY